MRKTVLTISHQAGDDGQLFGSVTSQEIADAVRQARGVRLDKRRILLSEPIRTTGTHMVTVEVVDGVTADIKTIVTPQASMSRWPSQSRLTRRAASLRHNEEAEASVLGAILLTEQALDGVLLEVGLKPEHFYRPRHATDLPGSMIHLKEKAEPEAVDALTVCDDLRRAGQLEDAGGEAYIHSLPTVVPAVGAVMNYARIVHDPRAAAEPPRAPRGPFRARCSPTAASRAS